jgi:acetolactate synthase-like protein
MFWKPTVAIQGDVGSFMVKLAEGMKGYKCDEEWLNMLRSKDTEKEKANRYQQREFFFILLNQITNLLIEDPIWRNNSENLKMILKKNFFRNL